MSLCGEICFTRDCENVSLASDSKKALRCTSSAATVEIGWHTIALSVVMQRVMKQKTENAPGIFRHSPHPWGFQP